MKAVFTSKQGHRVTVEPMTISNKTDIKDWIRSFGSDEFKVNGDVEKKTSQIMKKRGIETELTIEG